jgi:pimeloyl-ACP methyl ester carboxylesterase
LGNKPTKLKVNPVDDVPWGGYITLSGRLTDESGEVPLDGKEITLSSSDAPVDWNIAPIPTRTADGGYFSVSIPIKKSLAHTNPWGITLRFPGDEEWKEKYGYRVYFRTLKHKTQLKLEDTENNVPASQQITFTSFLIDITSNSPLENRDVHFNGNGVIPIGHNPNVPVPEYKTTVRTNLEGKAAFTGVAPNVTSNSWTYQARFYARGNDDGYYEITDSVIKTFNTIMKKTPIILIPGIMGTSIIRNTDSKELWPSILTSNIIALALDSNGNDIPNQAASPGRVIRSFLTRRVYSPTFDFFIRKGYVEGRDLFEFPYDWRKDLRIASQNLEDTINQAKEKSSSEKVILVAHSMGGLVARHYLINQSNTRNIEKIFILGTPHIGAPKSYASIRYGREGPIPWWMPTRPTPSELMLTIGNMLGLYMLLPTKEYETISKGGFLIYNDNRLNLHQTYYENGGVNIKMIESAMKFHDDLEMAWDKNPFVETYVMIGKLAVNSTIGTIIVNVNGTKVSIKYGMVEGDKTVPLISAKSIKVPSTNVFEFNTEHQDLAPDINVLSRILSLIEKV